MHRPSGDGAPPEVGGNDPRNEPMTECGPGSHHHRKRRRHLEWQATWWPARTLRRRMKRWLVAVTLISSMASMGTYHLLSKQTGRHSLLTIVVTLLAGVAVVSGASRMLSQHLSAAIEALYFAVVRFGGGKATARAVVSPRAPVEIRHLAGAFNRMADRIQAELEDQRALLGAVSHELRSPLARVRVLSDIAREQPAGRDRALADLDTELREMDELIGKLLADARLDLSSLKREPLNVVEVVTRAANRAGSSIEVVSDGPVHVRGDATLLGRAIENVIENAVNHGGGVHNISVSADAEHALIDVIDHGTGARSVHDTVSASSSGVRFGLRFVKRVLDAHGGEFTLKTIRDVDGARPSSTPGAPTAAHTVARLTLRLTEQPAQL